jgi:hypothetical protein
MFGYFLIIGRKGGKTLGNMDTGIQGEGYQKANSK